jgi:hypothetical protein
MTKSRLWIAGGVAAVALAATALTAFAQGPDGWGRGGDGPGMHAGMMGGMGGMGPQYMGRRFCESKDSVAPRILGRLESSIRPTDAQKPDFDALKAAAVKAEDIMRSACPSAAEQADRTPPARLALAEKRMTAALEALKAIRGPFDSLYAKLDDSQRDRLRWMNRRG